MKLDLKDKKILAILDKNARMPITQIAKKIRLNKDVVRYRINNLEQNKIVTGYYTIINTPKLGYITVRIYFDLVDFDEKIEQEFIKFLDSKFKAGQIFKIDGEYQLGILTWEKTIYDLEKKLKELKQKFGDHINKQSLAIFTQLNHYFRKVLPNSSYDEISLKKEELITCDKTDLSILKEISKNARISIAELSNKLKIPQRTVSHRIKQLEKKRIILAYRASIDIRKIGLQNYFLEIYTHQNSNLKSIESFAFQHKNCTYSDYVLSGADIELEMEFSNKQELLSFISQLKKEFSFIKKIKYWSTLEYIKIDYLPEL